MPVGLWRSALRQQTCRFARGIVTVAPHRPHAPAVNTPHSCGACPPISHRALPAQDSMSPSLGLRVLGTCISMSRCSSGPMRRVALVLRGSGPACTALGIDTGAVAEQAGDDSTISQPILCTHSRLCAWPCSFPQLHSLLPTMLLRPSCSLKTSRPPDELAVQLELPWSYRWVPVYVHVKLLDGLCCDYLGTGLGGSYGTSAFFTFLGLCTQSDE